MDKVRIRILCGICKVVKHYGMGRGVKKISNVIACENCIHFYFKLKKNKDPFDCISPMKGSCFQKCSFMKSRCKCCWLMQILDSCPHSETFYNNLSEFLSADCKKLIRGVPMALEDVNEDTRGKAVIEAYENDEWTESPTSKEEIEAMMNSRDDNDVVSEAPSKVGERHQRNSNKDKEIILSMADLALEVDDEIDEEAMVDDPAPVEVENTVNKLERKERRGYKASERIKRKRKKVEYFTKPVVNTRRTKGPIYGPDGKIVKTGMDLCDCLQEDCLGCHFPCPKCRSPKCGNECRVNRRWYYEKVEVEGTKLSFTNQWVPNI